MRFQEACIPFGFGWSSPFARWQGPFAEMSSLDLAVQVTRQALALRDFEPSRIDRLVLGTTTPQRGFFYGAPTVAARLGAEASTGPMIAQACATSVACIEAAALRISNEPHGIDLVVTTDRTSNSPLLVYPSAGSPGGMPSTEHPFFDNIGGDPWALRPMIDTAERVAEQGGMAREQVDEVALLRYEQYERALADDHAFQREYMIPVSVPGRRGTEEVVEFDVGVRHSTAEGLAKLEPVVPGGVVTYGSQTHPADGTAGMLVTGESRARELSGGEGIVRLLATGSARAGKAEMPKAPVPAALEALDHAGLSMDDIDVVTTHNPFAVNDIWFGGQTGFPLDRMNQYGSSLVFGHPNGPTGARLVVELIHTLRRRGGGTGLFTGCAAGDTAMALVLRLED